MIGNNPLGVSANWLAYSPGLRSEEIIAGCGDCAADLAADGFTQIELPIAHLDEEIEALGEAFWRRLRRPFDAAGIRIRSVHGPVLSFDKYPLEREAGRLQAYSRAAAALGASALVVHPVLHSNLHVCAVAAEALKRDEALAGAACKALEGTGCRLAIENVPHNSWAYLAELFRRLPDAAGMCFDTGHYLVRPEIPLEDALRGFRERIVCFHLNDNHGFCDEHLPPGEGSFPWSRFREAAEETRDPPVILELSPPALSAHPDARGITRETLRSAHRKTLRTLQGDPAE